MWLIFRRIVGVTAGALVAGGVAALMLARLVTTLLYDVEPEDAVTLASAVSTLAAAAAIAAWLPARRAARLDPVAALRDE